MAAVSVTSVPVFIPDRIDAPDRHRRPPARLRLVAAPAPSPYRRRQAVALVLAVVLLAVASAAAGRVVAVLGGVPASAPEHRPAPATYLVQPGDTLWSIARQLQPEGDIRPFVHDLVAANGGAGLQIGQPLAVP